MAGIKISDLPSVVAPALTDVFPIDQGAVTYKESGTQLLSLFQSSATGTWAINISGNAATATLASTVTTNANLTGDVTSVGNATTYALNVPLNRGGLNAALVANNGGIFYSTATAGALLSGTATAGQILRSGASAAPSWSTAVYPTAAGAVGNVLTSDGTNWISSAATGGNPLTTKGDLFTFTTVDARLPVGTINGQYLQVNSGTATGLAWSTATLPATAANAARILRSDGTNWVETTATFADIYGASGFLYANGANNVAGLATAINGLPVTDNTGVPSILAGPAATGRVLTSNAAAAPSWSTSTFPTTGGAAGNILISNGTNYVASTSLWPNTVGTVGKLLRSDGTTNAYTTSTYPDTNAVSTLLYASSANVMAALATANNSVLVTSAGGVPSLSTTLPAGLTIPGYAASGANSDITSMTGITGVIQGPTFINDVNGNEVLRFNSGASSVNYVGVQTSNTGVDPIVEALGDDTNITLSVRGKGTGGATIEGTSTNDSAAAGYVGEFISSVIAAASAVSVTNITPTNVTSISLTAGDWDVFGNINLASAGGGVILNGIVWSSATSATIPDGSLYNFWSDPVSVSVGMAFSIPTLRYSLSATTTIYLSCYINNNAVGTSTACGGIYARRAR